MPSRQVNLLSILAAVSVFVLLIAGAAVTSSLDQPKLLWLSGLHRTAAMVVTPLVIVVIGLVTALFRSASPALSRFSWILLVALLCEVWLGYRTTLWTAHAILSALLFAGVSVIALVTSPSWQREPEFVRDYGWPSLRFLSAAAAFLVAVQVGFGAAMRHNATGVLPHLLGALIVAIFIIIVGVFATNQFPKHATLRPLAVTLMVITGVQVFLGMAAFLMKMMNLSASAAWLAVSVSHVATGNLTLAFSVMLAIEIRRNVRPRLVDGS